MSIMGVVPAEAEAPSFRKGRGMRKVIGLGVLASMVSIVSIQGCSSDDSSTTSEFVDGGAPPGNDEPPPPDNTFGEDDGGGKGDASPGNVDGGPAVDAGQPVCGDGNLQGTETCDDGNTKDGDGCSALCTTEANWVCNVPGQPCAELGSCGDGELKPGEDCDDGDKNDNDGCSSTCKVEPGWACPIIGAACVAAQCGDGYVAGDEECDDKNSNDTDGCTNGCKLMDGYKCPTPGAACETTTCGDGKKEGTEQCDDGNLAPYDGCSPTCTVEPTCGKSGGACQGACGDGIIFPGEECDDGNAKSGDGCSSTCKLEAGFTCTAVAGELPGTINQPIIYRDFSRGDKPNPAPSGCTTANGCPNGHPDMNTKSGAVNGIVGLLFDNGNDALTGRLDGTDGKPQLVCNPATTNCTVTSKSSFDQWYRDLPGDPAVPASRVNYTFYSTLPLTKQGNGSYQYSSSAFFPIDGKGFGNQLAQNDCGGNHNFHFTSEMRFWFLYDQAAIDTPPSFNFTGDDDVFVFINGRLAVDIGGVHSQLSRSVTLSPANAALLGLEKGKVYEFALFQAERNRCESNYKATFNGFARAKSVCEPKCGDGIRTKYEACDDGANNSTSSTPAYGKCAKDCKSRGPFCGDGTTQNPPESCDDGPYNGGYGKCKADCSGAGPKCGDGVVQSNYGEICDDGPNNDTNAPGTPPAYGKCSADCRARPRCGDGIVQAPEQCDDGNLLGGDTCSPECKITSSGPK